MRMSAFHSLITSMECRMTTYSKQIANQTLLPLVLALELWNRGCSKINTNTTTGYVYCYHHINSRTCLRLTHPYGALGCHCDFVDSHRVKSPSHHTLMGINTHPLFCLMWTAIKINGRSHVTQTLRVNIDTLLISCQMNGSWWSWP